MILKNEGLTPAIIVHYSREVRYQEEPGLFENLPKPQYPPTQFVVEIRVAGGGQISGEDGLEMFYGDQEMPEDFQEEIRRGKRRVVLYGRVQYKDVFTPMLHTTGYGFVYSRRQRRFIQIGRSDYNYLD